MCWHTTDKYAQTKCKRCPKGFSSSPGTTRCYANPTAYPTAAPTAEPTFEHPAKTFNPTWVTRAGLYATFDVSGPSWKPKRFTHKRIQAFRKVVAAEMGWTVDAVRLVDPKPHASRKCNAVKLSGLSGKASGMGTYKLMKRGFSGSPAYYNSKARRFLYALDTPGGADEWVVSDKLGSTNAQLAIKATRVLGQGLADLPKGKWHAADGKGGWTAVPKVSLKCARVPALRVTMNVMPEGCAATQLEKMATLRKRLHTSINTGSLKYALTKAGFRTLSAHLHGGMVSKNCDVDLQLFKPNSVDQNSKKVSAHGADCKLEGKVVKMTHKKMPDGHDSYYCGHHNGKCECHTWASSDMAN